MHANAVAWLRSYWLSCILLSLLSLHLLCFYPVVAIPTKFPAYTKAYPAKWYMMKAFTTDLSLFVVCLFGFNSVG